MQTSNPFFEHFAKAMTEAAGAADGMRQEAETMFRSQVQKFLADSDLVQREEFEAVREMAVKAMEENANLKQRIETLEAKLDAK
ncbi:accessory factor UbiK family protein [Parvularcula flava]|uniref:Accessory factor UbiK family protein n=1 Tax=Aquisalinus luteolus TaxID=1566827 RepID=A0A8J3EPC4_9PROT|nr:accessory factor UbiK family protein [Aquisalinus luteolus]NHK27742.1 accessory factor UbiK family protein [Aquisalinus luteolus]GGH96360.1 hypothetical protein GCM10011355_15080 [Aquisalinus luteolus]